MIAMAIANDPDVIIADEPTTALDVTIQAQVLEVLRTAREVTGAAIVMITHDLGVVAGFADRVAVMYAGRIVETGTVDEVFYRPRMPYTMGLLGSIPRADDVGRPPARADRRHPAVARRPAAGLPVRAALPARVRHLPRGRAGAARGRQPEPPVRLPPRREDRGGRLGADRRLPAARAARGRRRTRPARGARRRARGRGPRPALPAAQGRGVQAPGRHRAARSTASASTSATGETLGPRRRVGLRQDDDAAGDPRARRAAGRADRRARRATSRELGAADRRAMRRDVQVVFQDPMASLDPRMPVERHPRRAAAHARHVARDRSARACASCCASSASTPSTRPATRSSSPAASASASASPARSRSSPSCSCSTSRCPRSTSRSRPASSTCSRSCGPGSACPICSSRTTSRSSVTSPTGSP